MMVYEAKTHTKVYLVKTYEEDIKASKVLSIKQVLCSFLYNHNNSNKLNETIHASATKTVEGRRILEMGQSYHSSQARMYRKKVTGLFGKWKAPTMNDMLFVAPLPMNR